MTAIKRPVVDLQALQSGDHVAFVLAVASCANKLFSAAGSHIAFHTTAVDAVKDGNTAKAGLFAAAMDLRELLAQSPDGRQALRNFGFKPFLENVEGK